ncbi:MAG: chemotaxis protein CheR [Desulfovibrio sp.]|nr:chemotaxis protein CheR [Desulfovibrio sp.]
MSTSTPFDNHPPFGSTTTHDDKEKTPFGQSGTSPFAHSPLSQNTGKPASSLFSQNAGQNQAKPFSSLRSPSSSFGTQNQTRTFGTQAKDTTQGLSRPQAPAFGQRPATSSFGQRPAAPAFGKSQPAFGTRPQTSPLGQTTPRPSFRTPQAGRSPLSSSGQGFHKDMTISDEEFILLRDFIYQKCGIFIAENRKYLVENRLSNRIKTLNLKSYSEYYKYLRFDPNKDAELNELYVLMTTNETSFFRNPPQLKVFQEEVLTNMINEIRKTGQKRLRIWSAGCSTGEEPYTLAIIISEVLKSELQSWDVKITANDLSTQVLAAARQGIYSEYSLRTTPKELVSKYFKKEEQVYKIIPDMKRLISFGQINLNERDQIKRVEHSHIVFCRNVIIYFDDDMKRRVINSFYDNLLPGGALLIGHSETLHNICRSFKLEHYAGTIVYRKLA